MNPALSVGMLRIDVTRVRGTLIALTGRLAGEEVDVFQRTCSKIGGPITFDLSQLRSADEDGLAALRRHLASGVEVSRATTFIELLLKHERQDGEKPGVPPERFLQEGPK